MGYDNDDEDDDQESPFNSSKTGSDYYKPDEFQKQISNIRDVSSYFHLNYHGLNSNWDSLLCDLHAESFAFHFFGISEVLGNTNDGYFCLPGYHEFLAQRRDVRSLLYKI